MQRAFSRTYAVRIRVIVQWSGGESGVRLRRQEHRSAAPSMSSATLGTCKTTLVGKSKSVTTSCQACFFRAQRLFPQRWLSLSDRNFSVTLTSTFKLDDLNFGPERSNQVTSIFPWKLQVTRQTWAKPW